MSEARMRYSLERVPRAAPALALAQVFYQDDHDVDAYLERFSARYGALSGDTIVHALAGADEFDRLIALFICGLSDDPADRARVTPFVTSQNPWERWVSALCLGVAQEPSAFPLICALLTDQWVNLPGNTALEEWRICLARLLGAWQRPDAVPPLRGALSAALETLRVGVQADPQDAEVTSLHAFSDEVVFALGRLRATGALTGLTIPPNQLALWRIHLIVGSLYGRIEMPPGTFALNQADSAVVRQVYTLLEHEWGIRQRDAQTAMRHYEGWKVETLYQQEFIEHKSLLELGAGEVYSLWVWE